MSMRATLGAEVGTGIGFTGVLSGGNGDGKPEYYWMGRKLV